MKSLSERLKILGIAFGAVLLLGFFLLRAHGGPGARMPFPTGLAAALVVPAAAAWWLRRHPKRGAERRSGGLVDLESLKLQPGRTLHLVAIEDQKLLVACSESGIQLVCKVAATQPPGSAEMREDRS